MFFTSHWTNQVSLFAALFTSEKPYIKGFITKKHHKGIKSSPSSKYTTTENTNIIWAYLNKGARYAKL